MLLGEYEHTIDDKNRLTLPAKFRQAFADGVILTRGSRVVSRSTLRATGPSASSTGSTRSTRSAVRRGR